MVVQPGVRIGGVRDDKLVGTSGEDRAQHDRQVQARLIRAA
jgi:hypothetical protein